MSPNNYSTRQIFLFQCYCLTIICVTVITSKIADNAITSSKVNFGTSKVITLGKIQIIFDKVSFNATNNTDFQHTWNFPKAFANTDGLVIVGSAQTWIGDCALNIWAHSATQGKLVFRHNHGSTTNIVVNYIAIGPAAS